MSASISVRWRIVGDFRRDIWVRIGRRFAYDETRIVVRKTKWYWRELPSLDSTITTTPFFVDARSSLGGVLSITHGPTGHMTCGVLPHGCTVYSRGSVTDDAQTYRSRTSRSLCTRFTQTPSPRSPRITQTHGSHTTNNHASTSAHTVMSHSQPVCPCTWSTSAPVGSHSNVTDGH